MGMEHIGCYLKQIYFQRKEGNLIVWQQDAQKNLFFKDGNLVSAETNQHHELLGEILYQLGKISDKDYFSLKKDIQPQKKLGETLINKGLISSKDLKDALLYQMREIALNLFSVFEGKFNYIDEQVKEENKELKINIPVLIEEGIRRMKYNPRLKDFLQDKIPYLQEREFFFRLTQEEREVLTTIDGKSSAEELFHSSSFTPDFFWKTLYLCYCLNLINIKSKDKEDKKSKKQTQERVLCEETEKNLAEGLELSKKLSEMNYYQILSVSKSSSEEEIKKAYFRLAHKFHPDLFAGEISSENKEKIGSVFHYISKAYRVLTDKEKREDYDRQIDVQSPEGKKDAGERAEVRFRKGKTLYDQGRYEEALILLEDAVRLIGNKGKYYLLLAMSESKIPTLHKKAEQDFLRAIKLDSWNPEGFVGLGMLYKSEGFPVKAEKNFKRALSLDPHHRVALRELSDSPKKGKKKGLKGLLSLELKDLKNILTSDAFSKKKK